MTDAERVRPSFETRFGIEVSLEEAQRRFRTRIDTRVLNKLTKSERSRVLAAYQRDVGAVTLGGPFVYETGIMPTILEAAGAAAESLEFLRATTGHFEDFLRIVELAYQEAREKRIGISREVELALEAAEHSLGIGWHDGVFWPQVAAALEDPIQRYMHALGLRDEGFASVATAYMHGRRRLEEAGTDENELKDVIVSMYEALEGVAKMITGRDRTLNANQKLLARELRLPVQFEGILTQLVDYGNTYRHAPALRESTTRPSRPTIRRNLAEAYTHLVGAFIRLADGCGKANSEA
jgi:hypothetical protein